MKAPLNAIITAVEMLIKGKQEFHPEVEALLKPILNSSKILACQVNSLLDKSLIANKKFNPIIQEF